MTGAQRVLLSSMIATLVINILILSVWIHKPGMAVLATGMDLPSAGDAIKELEEKKVDYKIIVIFWHSQNSISSSGAGRSLILL